MSSIATPIEAVKPVPTRFVSLAAFTATAGLLTVLPVSLSAVFAIATIGCLTHGALSASAPSRLVQASTERDMDAFYAAQCGVLWIAASMSAYAMLGLSGVAGLVAAFGLFGVFLLIEGVVGCVATATITKASQGLGIPVGIGCALHSRFFGRFGRFA